MQALGMIEVRGYLTAVEALDSALKAANVSLADVVCVGGGLVSVFVNGEVGAVKAAMDAAAAAADAVGSIISTHVIPRPSADVADMIVPKPEPEQPAAEAVSDDQQESKEDFKKMSKVQLLEMTVADLRKTARDIGIDNLTRKEIRFAKKQELIDAIMSFQNQK